MINAMNMKYSDFITIRESKPAYNINPLAELI